MLWSGIVSCYKQSAWAKPKLRGEATLSARVSASGKIGGARRVRATLDDGDVVGCWVQKLGRLAMPRAITPTHYITIGLNEDLDDAAKQALRDMIAWLVEMKGWKPAEAYVFCSLACDLHVTQLVDGNKGIHAMLAKSLLAGR